VRALASMRRAITESVPGTSPMATRAHPSSGW
jgi:hypothetical protein